MAALKAVPAIVGLLGDIRDGVKTMADNSDDSRFEKFKKEINTISKRMENAQSKEETAALVRQLNSLK